jgi:hypothetical protein
MPREFVVTSVGSATSKYVFTAVGPHPERIPGLEPQHEPRKETPRWGYQHGDRLLIVHAHTRMGAASKLAAYVVATHYALFNDLLPLPPSIEEMVIAEGEMAGG